MKPRTKFLIGGALVVGVAGYLMASSIRETGVYYFTPTELSAKIKADPGFTNAGVKVGARVVPGSIRRDPGGREYAFRVTDGTQTMASPRIPSPTVSTSWWADGWVPTVPSTRPSCWQSARRVMRTRLKTNTSRQPATEPEQAERDPHR